MRIEEDLKLDFKDVLIRPKRSEARSRKDVVLKRKYTFRNGTTWVGTPIIAANMDGVGTFGMSKALMAHDLMTCLVKSYTVDDYIANHQAWSLRHSIISTGISNSDLRKVSDIINTSDAYASSFVCVDVANGYTEHFINFIRKFKELHPSNTLIAGNVVTADMTQELILAGADIVKVGIGPGCFVAGSKVMTSNGLKCIEDIVINDEVWTHKNRLRKVTNTFIHKDKKEVIKINNIKSTLNHEYYVLHKKHTHFVTDDNIEELAQWVPAGELTKDYLLLKRK